jgi:hypothetical protein
MDIDGGCPSVDEKPGKPMLLAGEAPGIGGSVGCHACAVAPPVQANATTTPISALRTILGRLNDTDGRKLLRQ